MLEVPSGTRLAGVGAVEEIVEGMVEGITMERA
jgi:hypothetical protein